MSDVTLFNADCLEVLPGLAAGSVDAVIMDPPYSSGGAMRSDRMAATSLKYVMTGTQIQRPDFLGDNRDQRGMEFWLTMVLSFCFRACREGAPIMIFSDWRQLPMMSDILQAGGFVWRGVIPWNKTEAARPVLGRFRAQCEYVLWGSRGSMGAGNEGEALPGFFTYVVRQAEKFHITGKPESLMLDLMRITRPGDLVLDPFMGSGTTGVAAIRAGRRFVGVEQEPGIFETAAGRIRQEQAQLQLADLTPNPFPSREGGAPAVALELGI